MNELNLTGQKVKFSCPVCEKKFNITIHPIIISELQPYLEMDLFYQSLFDFECPGCLRELRFFYPVSYHNLRQQTMIHLFSENKEKRKQNQLVAKELEKRFQAAYRDQTSFLYKLYREFYTGPITTEFRYQAVYSTQEMSHEVFNLQWALRHDCLADAPVQETGRSLTTK